VRPRAADSLFSTDHLSMARTGIAKLESCNISWRKSPAPRPCRSRRGAALSICVSGIIIAAAPPRAALRRLIDGKLLTDSAIDVRCR
jgi:hypothetical protein